MAKKNPQREKAFELYKQRNGDITNRAIAEEVGAPEKTISAWKSRDKWKQKLSNNTLDTTESTKCSTTKKECSTANKKRSTTKKKKDSKESAAVITINLEEAEELTDKQRLFCIYYVKNFNATQAAIKANYAPDSAHVMGSQLLRNPKVASYIKELKQTLVENAFLEAADVLNKYIAIAFADITDYVSFGQRDQQVMTMYGPLFKKGTDGKVDLDSPVMETVNYVDLKDSTHIDGTIVTEVKEGKDGISIKLADKMRALDKLSLYYDLFTDPFKRKVEEEKLRIAQEKWDLEKKNHQDQSNESEQWASTLEDVFTKRMEKRKGSPATVDKNE